MANMEDEEMTYSQDEFPFHWAVQNGKFSRTTVLGFVLPEYHKNPNLTPEKVAEMAGNLARTDAKGDTFINIMKNKVQKEEFKHAIEMLSSAISPEGLEPLVRPLISNAMKLENDFSKGVKKWKELFDIEKFSDFSKKKQGQASSNEIGDAIGLDPLFQLFISSDFVLSFLTRSADKVIFLEDNAPKIDNKYEEAIYTGRQLKIPYRADYVGANQQKTHFFNVGGLPNAQDILLRDLNNQLSSVGGEIDVWTGYLTNRLQIENFCKDKINESEFSHPKGEKTDKSYLLMHKDNADHAVLFVGVVDNKNVEGRKNIESLIMINSLVDNNNSQKKGMLYSAEIGRAAEPKDKNVYGKVPIFVDASLIIQKKIIEDDQKTQDENCMIYRADYSLAFVKMLAANPTLKSKIESVNEETAESLGSEIRDRIKQYLPMYFKEENGVYTEKTRDEFIEYFKQRRWDIGSEYIKRESKKP